MLSKVCHILNKISKSIIKVLPYILHQFLKCRFHCCSNQVTQMLCQLWGWKAITCQKSQQEILKCGSLFLFLPLSLTGNQELSHTKNHIFYKKSNEKRLHFKRFIIELSNEFEVMFHERVCYHFLGTFESGFFLSFLLLALTEN